MDMIITRNKYYLFLLFAVTYSFIKCSTKNKTVDECFRFDTRISSDYTGNNDFIKSEVEDFIKTNTNQIDILRLTLTSSYDKKEEFARIVAKNNSIYKICSDQKIKILNININNFNNFFKETPETGLYISCNLNSSKKYNCRYFIKIKGNLVFTFSSNQEFKKIDKLILGKDYKYINYFEDLFKL